MSKMLSVLININVISDCWGNLSQDLLLRASHLASNPFLTSV